MKNNNLFQKNTYLEKIKKDILIKGKNITTDKYADKTRTRQSIALKTIFLLFSTVLTSTIFFLFMSHFVSLEKSSNPLFSGGIIGLCLFSIILQFILVLISNKVSLNYRKTVAISYALLKGITIGTIVFFLNCIYYNAFSGIILAIACTFGLFLLIHILYYNGIIKVNDKFKVFLSVSLITLIFVHLIMIFVPSISINPLISIPVTLLALFIGCMCLASDLDSVEILAEYQIEKEKEWNVALGLHITLIFIFIQIIRLLQYFRFFIPRNN